MQKRIFVLNFVFIVKPSMTTFLHRSILTAQTLNDSSARFGGTSIQALLTYPLNESHIIILFTKGTHCWTDGSLSIPSDIPLSPAQTEISNQLQSILHTSPDTPEFFTEEEVSANIHSLPSKKAAGPDNITNEHLTFAGTLLSAILTHLFNAILPSGHVPICFRHGYIIPILKNRKKDKCKPSNYRGISLLSSQSKLFEKLLLLRLDNVSTSLNPLQGGFRRGFSCLHTDFIFQEAVAAIREQKKKAFVAFLDAHKAFDTVWHSGLLVKLHQWKIPMYI